MFLESGTFVSHVASTIALTAEGEGRDVRSFDGDIATPKLSAFGVVIGDEGVNISEKMESCIANTSGRGVREDDRLLINQQGGGREGLEEGSELGWGSFFVCFML